MKKIFFKILFVAVFSLAACSADRIKPFNPPVPNPDLDEGGTDTGNPENDGGTDTGNPNNDGGTDTDNPNNDGGTDTGNPSSPVPEPSADGMETGDSLPGDDNPDFCPDDPKFNPIGKWKCSNCTTDGNPLLNFSISNSLKVTAIYRDGTVKDGEIGILESFPPQLELVFGNETKRFQFINYGCDVADAPLTDGTNNYERVP